MDHMENSTRLKAVALYRVSTKQQAGESEDLALQKHIVQQFLQENGIALIREIVEVGVSGYKKSLLERDGLIKVMDMVRNNEVSLLVIYHSNRFGRRHELAYLINEIYVQGVKVISVLEGELKTETTAEQLLNKLRFLNNEQDSYTKSRLIADYQTASIERGQFRGGSCIPYGYDACEKARKNHKGRLVMDLRINKHEADIVRKIYALSSDECLGQSRIAKWLNEQGIKTKRNGVWYSSTVQYLLNNPIYMGRLHVANKAKGIVLLSPVREDLVIIPETAWQINQKAMASRKSTKKESCHEVEKRVDFGNDGKMLLTGIAFCGHCRERLTTMTAYKRWTTKDGTQHKIKYHKYRCGSFYRHGGIECKGQSTYSAKKIEEFVVGEALRLAKELKGKKIREIHRQELLEEIADIDRTISHCKSGLAKAYSNKFMLMSKLDRGQEAIPNQEMLNIAEDSIESINENLVRSEELLKEKICIWEKRTELEKELEDWTERFENGTPVERKRMLLKIIDTVFVYREGVVINLTPEAQALTRA